MKNIISFSLLLAGVTVLSACGGGGGSTPAAGVDPQTTPTPTPTPTISFVLNSTSPLDGATQKADFPVVAIFSEPVDTATIDSNNFAVTAGVNPVTGVFSFSEDKTW